MSHHDLIEIHRERARDGSHYISIKWCQNCGAIVQDGEADGRTRPGHYMPMERPRMTKGIVCGMAGEGSQG